MKTRKYNTIGGLFRALKKSGQNYYTLSDYLSGRIYMGDGWCNIILSDPLQDKTLQIFAGAIWERGAAGKAWKLKSVQNCGILQRVAIRYAKNEYRAEYCAGQDYTAEIRLIQKIINR